MKSVWIIGLSLLTLYSCQPGQNWMKENLDRKEIALMKDAQAGRVDSNRVNRLLFNYEHYALSYPGDTGGAVYLFKAADFYRYLHRPAKSVTLYQTIYDRYPSFSKRPYSLFLQGFIYENEMGVMDSARLRYEKFLAEFPQHPIADDVKTTLNNLGKTPEQLIEEFMAKQDLENDSAQKGK